MKKIVLTGGPCGGKSTALSKIKEYYQDRDINVVAVPEVATTIGIAGIEISKLCNDNLLEFEKRLLKMQITLEQRFIEFAKLNKQETIVIFDRGVLDIKAYLSSELWDALISSTNYNEVELRDKRYDAVIHLQSAAIGAEEFYTTINNEIRTETIEEAGILDEKIVRSWTGHPHLRIIDNSTKFSEKINRVISEINSILGLPLPLEYERKFLVDNFSFPMNIPYKKIEITQTYLITSKHNTEERVRKRGQNKNYIYFHTIKKSYNNSRIENERQISPEEYISLINMADTNLKQIRKNRYCFVYKSQYFELDEFIDFEGLKILEIELKDENSKYSLPEFVKVRKEVTNNNRYKNITLASL